jgi:hypothetical protein
VVVVVVLGLPKIAAGKMMSEKNCIIKIYLWPVVIALQSACVRNPVNI